MAKIIRFPKTISIAFYSLVFLSLSARRMNVDEIAHYTSNSKNHTALILKYLAKNNFIKSQRGPAGGFGMARAPEEISLLEVWETMEGQFKIEGCISGHKACLGNTCIFSDKIYRIHKDFYDYLRENTIYSLVERVPESTKEKLDLKE